MLDHLNETDLRMLSSALTTEMRRLQSKHSQSNPLAGFAEKIKHCCYLQDEITTAILDCRFPAPTLKGSN